jgi:ornithine carbamoyltransferase
MQNMKGKDVISLHDLSVEEVSQIITTAAHYKVLDKTGEHPQPLQGKTLGLIFHKPSTRTRISFEVAMYQLGGYPLFLSAQDLQLKRGETIGDTAKVLSRYIHGIMIRTFSHSDVIELARHATIPVINGLTDLLHPCQALADYLTLYEKKGHLKGLKIAYVGDGNNVAHSLMFGGAKTGVSVTIGCPPGYEPDPEITRLATEDAKLTKASIAVTNDPVEAVRGADAVYTDVWTSMGQEEEKEARLGALRPYQVNAELMSHARDDAVFLHCLPAHRGEEVTGEVIDGPQSVVWDEAENRLHVQKAILALVM